MKILRQKQNIHLYAQYIIYLMKNICDFLKIRNILAETHANLIMLTKKEGKLDKESVHKLRNGAFQGV